MQVCRLDGLVSHLIWFTNEWDGVVLDESGSLLAFRDLSDLRGYAANHGFNLQEEESEPLDLDEAALWLKSPTTDGIVCAEFLDSWNLFDDIARSILDSAFPRLSKDASEVYDKLFWGSNLPAMTPPGEHFDPIWSGREVEELRRVLATGIMMLRRGLSEIAGDCALSPDPR